ncbi:cupin domain-containing protein [Paraburkholderia caballeronis]|uniref:Gentisate 1,2-dioxygenase n=1 Tax=Paraburkholderia caballeronis TaxID=416943 RepID=A0A1H7TUT5_9BURK|nr:cupin [Paraburkholderia caballeronis]PXW17661.1 gentisate 1,2-dioxygenase [Paraburkholderia caballeronis]PXW95406.1 gentisate 1,2-dioxygenase [Paraburkholderia caballeronis]RAJ91220.1 gentisate 1,2-dioxygenase [Paraburkholderia caballeronis]SEE12246.1 Gentisate 1,2-dioxygenase [Paraburkholderia caballeronis]SEL88288.1 Gentisate 1,2-dioxygenase [Paraburkholderia caballeronis]
MLQKTTEPSLESNASATDDAQYFEYTSSANPIGAKLISRVPYHAFPATLYADGPTRVVPLDLSSELRCDGPATGPGLCASFVRIVGGESVTLSPVATSQVFYVIDGEGAASQRDAGFRFAKGDFFTFPGGAELTLRADATARLYMVNDAPLLTYLGASFGHPRFRPTLYPASRAQEELRKVSGAAAASVRNRVSILLGNANFPQTRTVTHSLWAMFGVIAPGAVQKPHRHQSIALDFISDCAPGCYTLVGTELDEHGNIRNPQRVDWTPGMAFVTPPGYWHAHFNESDANGYVIPIQDAGLQTYLRSLDIQFAR